MNDDQPVFDASGINFEALTNVPREGADPLIIGAEGLTPSAVFIFGPPRSRRGRLANRLRRLLRRDEQDEIYTVLDTVSDGEPLIVKWDARGIYRLDD